MTYEPVIGLEIHVQLKTSSKMFCACANEFDIAEPNKNICPICTGHPGVLPVANQQAISFAIKAALALNLHINLSSKFDRKSYFYPDLPKGYQISQYDQPLATDGYLDIYMAAGEKRFGLERLHVEEDAAKNIHMNDYALVDYNRAGTPLIEIVTRPDFRDPQEARLFLQELRLIMRLLGVSDADMEKGQLRCDANISLRPSGDMKFYPKTEIKNLNSFRSVEKALTFEVARQQQLWEQGMPPETQSTRGWDERKNETVAQRTKEEASDYRYFPEPDLPPLHFTDKEIMGIRASLPELPNDKRKRLLSEYGFRLPDVNILIGLPGLDGYAEQVISELVGWLESSGEVDGSTSEIQERYRPQIAKLVSSWLLNNLLQLLNAAGQEVNQLRITPENFAELLTLVFSRRVNSSAAQLILEEMFVSGKDPSVILEEKDLSQAGDDELVIWVDKVIAENPEQVKQFRSGKDPIIKYLIGSVMKLSKGKADPLAVERLLRDRLQD